VERPTPTAESGNQPTCGSAYIAAKKLPGSAA